MTPAETAALGYLNAGLSVIPIRPGDKRPSLPWKEYQERRAIEAEVRGWYSRQPGAGTAIICGAISGILVVDGDPRNGDGLAELAQWLPPTPTAETGGGGRHHYFAVSPGIHIPKVAALLPGAVPHPVSWTLVGAIAVWLGRRSSLLRPLCDRDSRRSIVRPPSPRPGRPPASDARAARSAIGCYSAR
jgi:hypothetical protein